MSAGARRARLGLAAAAVLALAYIALVLAMLPPRALFWDFSHYYASAMILRTGGNPYLTDLSPVGARLGLQIGQINRGAYPPTFLLCFEPLTMLSPRVAYAVWQSIGLVCLIASVWILLAQAQMSRVAKGWLTIAVIFYAPVQNHLNLAQSQFVVLLLLVIAIRALERGRNGAAGGALALASLLRAFPVALAAYLVARRRWRALAWMAAWIAVGLAVTVAVVGVRNTLSFTAGTRLIEDRFFLAQGSNIALAAFITRIFWHLSSAHGGPWVESMRQIVALGARLTVAGVAFWATMAPSAEPDRDRRSYSLWIATVTLVSPTAWIHYLVMLILPFVAVADAAANDRASRRAIVMAVISYFTAEAGFLLATESGARFPFGAFVDEMSFFSLAAMWLALYWFVRDERE